MPMGRRNEAKIAQIQEVVKEALKTTGKICLTFKRHSHPHDFQQLELLGQEAKLDKSAKEFMDSTVDKSWEDEANRTVVVTLPAGFDPARFAEMMWRTLDKIEVAH
jgi:hypothetical protein